MRGSYFSLITFRIMNRRKCNHLMRSIGISRVYRLLVKFFSFDIFFIRLQWVFALLQHELIPKIIRSVVTDIVMRLSVNSAESLCVKSTNIFGAACVLAVNDACRRPIRFVMIWKVAALIYIDFKPISMGAIR